MKLLRLGPKNQEIPAIILNDYCFDIRELTPDIDGEFFSSGRDREAFALAANGEFPKIEDWKELRIGAPIARPQAVICIGLNYAAHAAESGVSPPTNPIVFFKHPNTIIGPNDDIILPRNSKKLDWEVELALVLGKKINQEISPADAESFIAGYCVANDVSERDFQLNHGGSQWGKGKSMATSLPLGPYLVPKESVASGNLFIRSWVNEDLRQDSKTNDLIFDVNEILSDLSKYMNLEAGDLILTGTPEGVALSGRFPYLKAGDDIRTEVQGLGFQRQKIRAFE